MTLREYMYDELIYAGFQYGEFQRALEHTIQAFKREPIPMDVRRIDNTYVSINEIWDTDIENYSTEVLDLLARLVRYQSLYWCLNVLHSRR